MERNPFRVLQYVIDARPEGVHQLFTRRGIYVEPTPESIAAAYQLYGKPFIGDLVNVLFPEADSDEGATPVEEQAETVGEEKRKWWEILFDAAQNASDVLNSFAAATGKTPASSSASASAATAASSSATSEKGNRTLLFLGAGLLAIIILVVVLIIKRK
jgi:hypothetical protein